MSSPRIQDFVFPAPFRLESGAELQELRLRYSLWGAPEPDGANVVWICHALTGSHLPEQWWSGLVGPGKALDPERHCLVCVNVPGSCYGSTGPLSPQPAGGGPYYLDFPVWTSRDVAHCFAHLTRELGFSRVGLVIGGSMGGQHALEWAASYPEQVQRLVVLASNAASSPWGLAWGETQRAAIEADSTWGRRDPEAGLLGMQVARMQALISYRAYQTYAQTQPHQSQDPLERRAAATYQRYQGQKLAKRMNAFTYYRLSQLLDNHDMGRKRGGVTQALQLVQAHSLVIGIDSDGLFPTCEQQHLAAGLPRARYAEISSLYGHDGFLLETTAIGSLLKDFLP